MFNMIMETDTSESKTTFIELQTIKKDDLFVTKSHLNHELDAAFSENILPNAISPIQPQDNYEDETKGWEERSNNDDNDEEEDGEEDYDGSSSTDVYEDTEQISDSIKSKRGNISKLKTDLKSIKSKSKKHSNVLHKTWNAPTNNKIRRKLLKKKKNNLHSKAVKAPKAVKQPAQKKPKCEYPRLCTGCGHAYKTKQSFWNHKQRCAMLPQNNMRNIYIDENGVPVEGLAGSNEFVRRKEYICAHCERHYRKKYNLQEHLKNTCRGKPCSKGRLQCWEEGCAQAFYKYVDLVQHVTLQHGQDLQIQKLQFPNFSAFNSWKTEESNSKFMYARKITGSKRFSNTKYHYFVCQFNHRNEKKNNNRKTNRRKSVNLVVPNYNCPSRIMVKECDNQIQVTYISSHNHELNLSNVKYQPLEKETRAYIKTLLQLGVSAKKIMEHLQEGVGNPEIDSFLATKQHFLTLNRIKRMESKLKAKNRARQMELANKEKTNCITNPVDNDSVVHDESFEQCEDMGDTLGASSSCAQVTKSVMNRKDSDEVIRSIENNLKKLKGYVHKSNIKEKLSDRISKMIQELCDECEHMETNTSKSAAVKKPRAPNSGRKRKSVATVVPPALPPPTEQQQQQLQPLIIQHQQPVQSHFILQQPIVTNVEQPRVVNNVINNVMNNVTRSEKSFTPAIYDNTDLLKPIFQPCNVNLLSLKSVDPYIPEREQVLLSRLDERFAAGWLCDPVVNSFLTLICQPVTNVITADTEVTEYVQMNQKVPDMWHCFNWVNIDTIFIPCNPTKKHWFLLVLLVKNSQLQVLDPATSYETIPTINYKKYESSIQCWYSVLQNFMGMCQCNVTFPAHSQQSNSSDSGVLVCWYAFQYINKRSLVDNIDADIFRKYMYNTIVSNSSPA